MTRSLTPRGCTAGAAGFPPPTSVSEWWGGSTPKGSGWGDRNQKTAIRNQERSVCISDGLLSALARRGVWRIACPTNGRVPVHLRNVG